MRYRLRTLLIVVALGPALAAAWGRPEGLPVAAAALSALAFTIAFRSAD